MTGQDSAALLGQARAAVEPFVARLAAHPQVEGVVFLSSAARTGERVTFDTESDLDMTVFVRIGMSPEEWHPDVREVRARLAERIPAWLPDFSFHVPLPWGPVEINLHQRIFEHDADPRTVWDESMREAHAYTAEIVHDRTGAVARLIAAKTARDPAADRDRLIRLASRLSWDLRVLPQRQLERGDAVAGHFMLGAALDELIEVAHVLGGRYLPHRKWRFHNLHRYGLATPEEIGLLEQAMTCRTLDAAEFSRRATALERAWDGMRRRLPADFPEDVYGYYSAHLSANRQLRAHTVAEEAERGWGGEGPVRDLTDFLVPDGLDELGPLAAAWADSLPAQWADLARRLGSRSGTPAGGPEGVGVTA